ncbi:hypothetical protein [Microbulbifer guangxiensis]|uniref:hypothetical protein n=1 Tax=Microbulbifer guangxiensis TaxID=2904249 RepID=UPI001F37F61A|nr:hypothetical protein [Microbulbifer guangxiensis]
MNPVQDVVSQIVGKRVWGARPGHGSFLTLEFGTQVKKRPFPSGEWHLWIYCCAWKLSKNNTLVCHSESKNCTQIACNALDDKEFLSLSFEPESGASAFQFSEKFLLLTWPYDESEQWMLYMPNSQVLTYAHDGRYSLGSGEESHKVWDNMPQ